ncbi:hypothetical protein [Pendulispora albinea]|uniref:Uncharacterized protein n=1 Tax=Pendulispora albinea TaxID=2741071 RepID=A0ABZ2LT51_9BACT
MKAMVAKARNNATILPLSGLAVASLISFVTVASAVTGCSSKSSGECLDENCSGGPGDPSDPNDPNNPGNPNNPNQVPTCGAATGVAHMGLGNVDLSKQLANVAAGVDRGRMKPFSALSTEYARVLGATNNPKASLDSSKSTFGEPEARWSQEPAASAVSLYTAYRVGFDGCLQLTGAVANGSGAPQGDAKYNTAPDAASAKAECEAWTRKFWSRAASPDEVQGCVDIAVTASAQEGTTPTPPKRRWAYACATVLSATGFLAY